MKKQVFIIDTSAILSGKPIHFTNALLFSTSGVSDELKPGGRDFLTFELLKEAGLAIHVPTKDSVAVVKKTAQQTGDDRRLSLADLEILALAFDMNKESDKEVVILTDDYSIQNVAATLQIKYQGLSQKGITKKFKWVSRCRGCGKQFMEPITTCPICGALTKSSIRQKNKL